MLGRATRTPHEPGGDGARRFLLAFAMAGVLPLLVIVALTLPHLFSSQAETLGYLQRWPVVLGLLVCLGLLQVGAFHLWRGLVRQPPPAPEREPSADGVPAGEGMDEVGQRIHSRLASTKSEEVAALLREFTRILNVFQQQASHIQEYGAQFEAMNEELRTANLRLREMSLTDELTEVGNRRNFDMRMREEINRSSRFGHAFSLLFLDIDSFKKFNDEFGHPRGDEALRALGALMRAMSREGDVPCRIGGEEFAFILPETVKADATTFAERIRHGVETNIKAPDGARPLTVSVGLAAFPEDGKTAEELLRGADEALYASKRAGRNRVTGYRRRS